MNGYSYNNYEVIRMKRLFPDEETLFKMRDMLSIVSDVTRLKIMFCLLDDSKCCHHNPNHNCGNCKETPCMIEKCVGEIVDETGASQSLVSHQLKTLKDFELVSCRREGKKSYYSLKDGHVKQLISVALEHAMEEE